MMTLAGTLSLSSPAFEADGLIPVKYPCEGANLNPPLPVAGVPPATKALVLIMDDPDAIKPAGKVWDHWLVFNIPSKVNEIHEHEEPEGVHGKGTGGNTNYKGPCPPDAEHRYFFKVYALGSMLELPEGSTKANIENAM